MDKDKKEEKIEEKVEVVKPQKPTHRYFCESCTGVAFYWIGQKVNPETVFPSVCQACGKPLGSIKPANFIKL